MARQSSDDAAELDWEVGRRARQVRARRAPGSPKPGEGGSTQIEVFTTRIDTILRRDVRAAGARASARRRAGREVEGSRRVQAAGAGVPDAGPRGALERRDREAGIRHRVPRDQSVHEPAGAALDRQLRAGRVRHGRGDGRARRTISATSSSRASSTCRSRSSSCRRARRRQTRTPHDRGGRRVRPHDRLGRVLRPGVGGRAEEDDRRREAARHRRRHRAVPAEGLGHLAAALLGHADPDDLLREGRHRPGARTISCPWCCRRSRSSPAAAIRRWRRCRSSST